MSTYNKVKGVVDKISDQSGRDPHATNAASQISVEPKGTAMKHGTPVYIGRHPDVPTSAPLGSDTGTVGTHTGSVPTHPASPGMATANSNLNRNSDSQQYGDSKSFAGLDASLSHPEAGYNTKEAVTSLVPPSGTNSHATGPAPNTAGPHKSDRMNAMDPRVDSDLDGSKTYGRNKTTDA